MYDDVKASLPTPIKLIAPVVNEAPEKAIIHPKLPAGVLDDRRPAGGLEAAPQGDEGDFADLDFEGTNVHVFVFQICCC